MSNEKDECIAASKRKNRALRKVTRLEGVDPIFKMLTLAIIDKLNCYSKYRVAWPSVPSLSKIIGRSERTTLRYLKKLYATGIFTVHRVDPSEAIEFLKSRFGVKADLSRCRKFAPNLYVINEAHTLWNSKEKMPLEVVEQLRAVAGAE